MCWEGYCPNPYAVGLHTYCALDLTLTSSGTCEASPGQFNATGNVVGLYPLALTRSPTGGYPAPEYPDDPAAGCFFRFDAGSGNPADGCGAGYGFCLYKEAAGTYRIRRIYSIGYGGPPEITGIVPLSESPLHIVVGWISYEAYSGADPGGTPITLEITE